MKKRIALKHKKQWFINNIIKPLRKRGYHFDYAKFLDGYFIFSYGKYSVFHFILKELPDIKFGVWSFDNKIEVFAEYIPYIDKFKPSATTFDLENAEGVIIFVEMFGKTKTSYHETLMGELKESFGDDYTYEEFLKAKSEKELYYRTSFLNFTSYNNAMSEFNDFLDYCKNNDSMGMVALRKNKTRFFYLGKLYIMHNCKTQEEFDKLCDDVYKRVSVVGCVPFEVFVCCDYKEFRYNVSKRTKRTLKFKKNIELLINKF